jgi:hypothetical protein
MWPSRKGTSIGAGIRTVFARARVGKGIVQKGTTMVLLRIIWVVGVLMALKTHKTLIVCFILYKLYLSTPCHIKIIYEL